MGTVTSPRLYRLVAEITYQAEDDDAAGTLAAELVALPMGHDAVWAAEGDFYRETGFDPLNTRTITRG